MLDQRNGPEGRAADQAPRDLPHDRRATSPPATVISSWRKPDGLVVFCQNSRLIDRYRDEIVRAPDRAANYYRLARAAEAIGREDTALESYREAIEKARPDETIDGIPLAGAARDHLFRMLMRQAGRRCDDRGAGTRRSVSSKSASRICPHATPNGSRPACCSPISTSTPSHPREAVDALERRPAGSRGSGRCPSRWTTAAGRSAPTSWWPIAWRRSSAATAVTATRLRSHGRGAAGPRQEGARPSRARGGLPRLSGRRGRCPTHCWSWGRCYESSGRLAEAAHAYKRLLAAAADERGRAAGHLVDGAGLRRPQALCRGPGRLSRAGGALSRDAAGAGRSRPSPSGSSEAAPASPTPAWSPTAASRRSPPPMFRRWHWAAPARPVGAGPEHRGSRPVAGGEPDRARLTATACGCSTRPTAPRDGRPSWARPPSGRATSTTS